MVIKIISEASVKTEKKYKCPYCEYRGIKTDLIHHISKHHEDIIPEGVSPARLVFNIVNKKDTGRCVICGKETQWNESTWRYERFCCEDCRKKASALAKKNMLNKFGKETLLNDPEHQNKMLAGRSISGTYKFSTGGDVSYVGSYELNFLKFLDEVMGFRASDVESPGPVIQYEYNGKTHYWITDQYIPSYNLVLDIKDGGSNPNTRNMAEYREKQNAKENAIKLLKTYNYVRLTDNDFAQLISVLAQIKAQMMDIYDSKAPIIKINESVNIPIAIKEYSAMASGPVVGLMQNEKIYVVPMLKKNSFSGEPIKYGVSSDLSLSSVFTDDNGFIKVIDRDTLQEEYDFSTFQFTRPENYKSNSNGRNLVEILTGKTILSEDQLLYDSDFEQVLSFPEELKLQEECLYYTLMQEPYRLPIMTESYINDDDNISYYSNNKGVFVVNNETGLRSRYFDKIEDINENIISYIRCGII